MNFKTPKIRIIINHLSFNTLLMHYTIRKKTYYRYFLTRFLLTLTKMSFLSLSIYVLKNQLDNLLALIVLNVDT